MSVTQEICELSGCKQVQAHKTEDMDWCRYKQAVNSYKHFKESARLDKLKIKKFRKQLKARMTNMHSETLQAIKTDLRKHHTKTVQYKCHSCGERVSQNSEFSKFFSGCTLCVEDAPLNTPNKVWMALAHD